MRNAAVIILTLVIFMGCDSKPLIPEGYYKASIIDSFCTPVAQVKGDRNSEELNKYKYIYIVNTPAELKHVGTEFYFKGYKEVYREVPCLTDKVYPKPEFIIEVEVFFDQVPKF